MKRVVIIGGGFAGSLIAKGLENFFSTILIDTKDYFEFTPVILRTLVEPEHLKKIHALHAHYLPKTKLIKGTVQEVDDLTVTVKINKKTKKIVFDYLVIASGSSYIRLIKDSHIIAVARAKKLQDYHYQEFVHKKKIVVVGGGLVGVELAAEIATPHKDKEVVIIEASDRLLSRQSQKESEYTKKFLENHNVTILLKEKVKELHKNQIITNTKKLIKCDLVLTCTGIKPNSAFMEKFFSDKLDKKKFIKVNKYLQLEGQEHIFVAGDIIHIAEEKLAQNAEYHAKIVIENIKNVHENKPLKMYQSKPRIMVISLGKYNGILSYKNFVLTGIIPGFLKSAIEWFFMLKYR